MTLTKAAQSAFDFSIECYRQGLCTSEQLKNALDTIFTDDLNMQSDVLVKAGFTPAGAFNHIHGTDRGEEIL